MGCRKQGTLPEPRLHKRGHLRLRVNGREFVLGQPGSRQADKRYRAILVAWGAGDGTLPADLKLDNKKPRKALPKVTREITTDVTVGDLVGAFIDDECSTEPNAVVLATDLLSAFREWCKRTGCRAFSRQKFARELESRGYRKEKPTGGEYRNKTIRYGITLN